MLRGRTLLLAVTVTATAVMVAYVPSASAAPPPTHNATWRGELSNWVGEDGRTLTNGEVLEYVHRYGSMSTGSLVAKYNAAGTTTAEKAWIAEVSNPANGSVIPALSSWQSRESAAEALVGSGAGTNAMKAGTSALYKARAAVGLAPRLLNAGALLYTVASTAEVVEKATVAGENKLFGWHIQLKGPFGIFGSWSGQSPPGNAGGTATVDGVKWRVETTQALCGNPNGCTAFDPLMGASLGGPLLGNTNGSDSTLRLFALEPHFNLVNNLGQTTFSAYGRDVIDAPRCTGGFWDGAFSSTPSNECSGSSDQSAMQQTLLYGEMSPEAYAGSVGHGSPQDGGSGVALPGGNGWSPSGLPDPGQWINTRNCSQSLGIQGVSCVAYVMTEHQMEKFLGLKDADGNVQSQASERDAHSGDATNIQGNIDPDQPAPTFVPSVGPISGPPMSDANRDAAQTAPDDGVSSVPQDQVDCSAATNNTDVNCPDPWATGFVVPDCRGLTPTDCQALLQNDGFTAAYATNDLDFDTADPVYGAGQVVATNPAAGADANPDQAFTFDVNPNPMPLIIPDVTTPNELATDYQTDLTTAGATGTLTVVQITDPNLANGQIGPDGVAQLTNTTTGEVISPGDRLAPDTPITIHENPDGMPAVSTSTSGCSCPPADFSPLTSLGLGSKFPFGMFTYAASIIGDFNVPASAPDFNLSVGASASTPSGTKALAGNYDANLGDSRLSAIDTYMGYWRDLVSFVLWAGAVWLVATKLLGFHAGGDITGGMDDGDPLL